MHGGVVLLSLLEKKINAIYIYIDCVKAMWPQLRMQDHSKWFITLSKLNQEVKIYMLWTFAFYGTAK